MAGNIQRLAVVSEPVRAPLARARVAGGDSRTGRRQLGSPGAHTTRPKWAGGAGRRNRPAGGWPRQEVSVADRQTLNTRSYTDIRLWLIADACLIDYGYQWVHFRKHTVVSSMGKINKTAASSQLFTSRRCGSVNAWREYAWRGRELWIRHLSLQEL
jgi:hypothetical protein